MAQAKKQPRLLERRITSPEDLQQGEEPNHGRTDDRSRLKYAGTEPDALTENRR
jgi:hypothetical protein